MGKASNSLRMLLCASGMLGVIVLSACGGDDDEPTTTSASTSTTTKPADEELDQNGFPVNAHIEPQLGAVPEGIEFEGREGTPPPAVGESDLQAASDAAGCELETGLPEEGSTHISDEDAASVDYKTNPPTSGDHYGNSAETLSG